ncbi:hypothetical protein [Peptostreptococcus porci]|uniref:hypothetical protein n=1 Tax=Peptostreptococcus porci TaxID=2652282 RepID=UPI002A7F235A|nr:hypothetical protein [Peptostreptococcus porci]MDY4127703.1 hypothetical protein [Peptostreptococcus porci]
MNLSTYKKAGDLLSEIQRTEELLESLKSSEGSFNEFELEYSIELNGDTYILTQGLFDELENAISKRIEELNVRFENL